MKNNKLNKNNILQTNQNASPEDRFMENILASFAQYRRETVGKSIKTKMQIAKLEGKQIFKKSETN